MKFACGIFVLLAVIYTATARFVPFEDVQDVEVKDNFHPPCIDWLMVALKSEPL
jgi:hypothetical protein